jgi:hypothetical protein
VGRARSLVIRTSSLDGDQPATADAESLRRFLEAEALPWFENRGKELANRPLIREQAFGEALDGAKRLATVH